MVKCVEGNSVCQTAVIICGLIKMRVSTLFFVMYVCMYLYVVASGNSRLVDRSNSRVVRHISVVLLVGEDRYKLREVIRTLTLSRQATTALFKDPVRTAQ